LFNPLTVAPSRPANVVSVIERGLPGGPPVPGNKTRPELKPLGGGWPVTGNITRPNPDRAADAGGGELNCIPLKLRFCAKPHAAKTPAKATAIKGFTTRLSTAIAYRNK